MEERELAIYSGAKIKELRKSKKMTQQELGDKIGVSNSAVANYEKGFRAPLQDTLFKLAEVFDVSVNDFFPQTTSTKDIESIYNQLTPPRKTRVYDFASRQLRRGTASRTKQQSRTSSRRYRSEPYRFRIC